MKPKSIVFIRLPQVIAKTGLPRATIYALVAAGSFPPAIKLTGARAVAWLESDIESWMQARIDASRQSASTAA